MTLTISVTVTLTPTLGSSVANGSKNSTPVPPSSYRSYIEVEEVNNVYDALVKKLPEPCQPRRVLSKRIVGGEGTGVVGVTDNMPVACATLSDALDPIRTGDKDGHWSVSKVDHSVYSSIRSSAVA